MNTPNVIEQPEPPTAVRSSDDTKIRFCNALDALRSHAAEGTSGECAACSIYLRHGDGDLCEQGKAIITKELCFADTSLELPPKRPKLSHAGSTTKGTTMNAPDNLPTPPGVGCSALLDGLVIEVAARHRVMPATLAAWYELHRKNAQSPRRANLIPLTASQLEGLHNLRRAFRELLSHETCAEAHSTRQHKGLECSCDVMPSNAPHEPRGAKT